MVNKPLAFVDVETTGFIPGRARIVEIAIIRTENGKVVGEMDTLVNPHRRISKATTNMLKVNKSEIYASPDFRDLQKNIKNILTDTIFVAHNVGFDLSFFQYEFGRLGHAYNPQKLCTVRLSRRLYPELTSHSLDNIVNTLPITRAQAHRAYPDADALFQLFNLAKKDFGIRKLNTHLKSLIK